MTRSARFLVSMTAALAVLTALTVSPAAAADTTPPTITGSINPAPNGFGWNDGGVTVHFDCADAESGIASCTPDQAVAGEGVQVITGTAVDNDGNQAQAQVTVKIDTTGPIVQVVGSGPRTKDGLYYTGPVTVHAECADELSGVATCSPDQVVAGEGPHNVPMSGEDKAGNVTNTALAFTIDATGPTIVPNIAGTLGDNGFYRSNVTITYACNDAGSGVRKCPSPDLVRNDGVYTRKATAVDNLGHVTTIDVPLKIDKTAPKGKINSPSRRGIAPGALIAGTASDGVSGVATVTVTYDTGPAAAVALACSAGAKSCTWTVPGPNTPGARTAYVTVKDNAGNTFVSPLTRFTVT